MRKVCLLIGAGLLLSACSASLRSALGLPTDASTLSNSTDGSINSDGVVRHYLLHVPADYEAGTPIPLIFNFHGYGSNSRAGEPERHVDQGR